MTPRREWYASMALAGWLWLVSAPAVSAQERTVEGWTLGDWRAELSGYAAGAPGLIGPVARDAAPALIRVTVADPSEQTRLTAVNERSPLGPEARPAILESQAPRRRP